MHANQSKILHISCHGDINEDGEFYLKIENHEPGKDGVS